jgi:hypothetical protein
MATLAWIGELLRLVNTVTMYRRAAKKSISCRYLGEREIFAVNISARERGSSPRPGARAKIGRSPFLVGPVNGPSDREEERARV